jgi:aquaporin Z
MEGTEIASLMLSICVFGTLLYSNDSPFAHYLVISREITSVLMGIAIAATTYLIICSPFGRRSGAHLNPAILSAQWLGW